MGEQGLNIKHVEGMLVAGIREPLPSIEIAQTWLPKQFDALYEHVNAYPHEYSGAWLDVWYDEEMQPTNIDVEVCAPIVDAVPESDRVVIHELPSVESMAYVLHLGSFDTIGETIQEFQKQIEQNGYVAVGPLREVYLIYSRDADPSTFVTEIQIPVRKLA